MHTHAHSTMCHCQDCIKIKSSICNTPLRSTPPTDEMKQKTTRLLQSRIQHKKDLVQRYPIMHLQPWIPLPCFQLMLTDTHTKIIKWKQKQVAFRKLINHGLRQKQEKRRVELKWLCQALSFIHYKRMNRGSLQSTGGRKDYLVAKNKQTKKKHSRCKTGL